MVFAQAYPERLLEVVDEGCADLVYVNCVLNLFCDPIEALTSIRRILKPGGLLVCDTVLSAGPRNASVVNQARALGNAVQAAPHRKDLMSWLGAAGFDVTSIETFTGGTVDPASDADGNPNVPVAASEERASFIATNVHVYTHDGIDRHARKLLKDISEFR